MTHLRSCAASVHPRLRCHCTTTESEAEARARLAHKHIERAARYTARGRFDLAEQEMHTAEAILRGSGT